MVRESEISMQFGFEIYEMIPMKGVYLIRTSIGNKCLKKIGYGSQKLMYIYKAKEHIINNGFNRIDRNLLTPAGAPFALVNDDVYVVTEWIDGRECDFRKEDDLELAAKNLAMFHSSARGFMPEEGVRVRNDIGRLPYTMEKRVLTLNKMRDIARKNNKKTEFDMLYITNVDFYIKLAQQAMKYLNVDSYYKVCNLALLDNTLCHHDYNYHNILVDKEGLAHIVDFDYCKSEIQVYDLSTLLIKSLKRLDWDIRYAELVLQSYNSIQEVSKDEINILKTLMLFPQRFWRLANRYYYNEANWGEDVFTKKLREILDEREPFLKASDAIEDIKL